MRRREGGGHRVGTCVLTEHDGARVLPLLALSSIPLLPSRRSIPSTQSFNNPNPLPLVRAVSPRTVVLAASDPAPALLARLLSFGLIFVGGSFLSEDDLLASEVEGEKAEILGSRGGTERVSGGREVGWEDRE